MIDLSWKWRKRRKLNVENHNVFDHKLIVTVKCKTDYVHLTEIYIDTTDHRRLWYYNTFSNPMSRMAYLSAFRKLWNERIIEREWDLYSDKDGKIIKDIFERELEGIKDIWAQEEFLENLNEITYYELTFRECKIVGIRRIKNFKE